VRVGRVEFGGPLIGVERVVDLVVATLVLEKRVSRVSNDDEMGRQLTKVPRSYQTSEMNGFRRIAREYASRASRY